VVSLLRSGYGNSVNVMDDKSDKQDFESVPRLTTQFLTFIEEYDKTANHLHGHSKANRLEVN
jgi:hypothetical protein